MLLKVLKGASLRLIGLPHLAVKDCNHETACLVGQSS